MNKRNQYSLVADALFVIIQSFLFSIIPVIVHSILYKAILLFTVTLISIMYYLVLRVHIISRIINIQGIDLFYNEGNNQPFQIACSTMKAVEQLYDKYVLVKKAEGLIESLKKSIITYEWIRIAASISNHYLSVNNEELSNVATGGNRNLYDICMSKDEMYTCVSIMLEVSNDLDLVGSVSSTRTISRQKSNLEKIKHLCNPLR